MLFSTAPLPHTSALPIVQPREPVADELAATLAGVELAAALAGVELTGLELAETFEQTAPVIVGLSAANPLFLLPCTPKLTDCPG